jgi:hypothetical protein
MTTTEAMLTTVDNPFDPFDQFDEWTAWDTSHGYNTSSFLARIVVLSDDTSEADQQRSIELAIDEIVSENVNGMYRKVTRTQETGDQQEQ